MNIGLLCSAVEFLTKVTGVPGSIHRPAIYCHCNNAQFSFPTVHGYVLISLFFHDTNTLCIFWYMYINILENVIGYGMKKNVSIQW